MNYLQIGIGIIDKNEPTDELLSVVVKNLIELGAKLEEANEVRKQIEKIFSIKHTPGIGFQSQYQKPWIDEYLSKIKWINWDAYKSYLTINGFVNQTINALDKDTNEILNYCGNPDTKDSWNIRGLVMGDVQSGKTANYAGLINKAADSGYKIIILLTGIIEELRSQTQERLDETFVGRNSDGILNLSNGNVSNSIGVGRFKDSNILCLTSVHTDFLEENKKVLQGIPLAAIKAPILLVMKKNKSALTNLKQFLQTNTIINPKLDLPMLLLDDEADNASVNANKDEDPTTINRLIREVMAKFERVSYVAYTATPFANIFINSNDNDSSLPDLFPSNFIYSLSQPTNYIGLNSLFSENASHSDALIDIIDAEKFFPDKHKKDLRVESIPDSMVSAIDAFLISTAIRDLRNEKLNHRSMLINVSRFTDVQKKIADLIEIQLINRKEYIKQYISDDNNWNKGGPSIDSLHKVWLEYFENIEFTWDQIRVQLYDSIAAIKVLPINQKSDEKLLYRLYKSGKGRRVIAVGGLTLSRGLTLEGLSVSYFYRSSKAYDTLLQMGRWFGYREGYSDLFLIWMDPQIQKWYRHISTAIDELRVDLRHMHINKLAPKDFGIRIKDHEQTLMVTAKNKMRNSKSIEFTLSFSNKTIETAYLYSSKEVNEDNIKLLQAKLKFLNKPENYKKGYIWSAVSGEDVANIISSLQFPINNLEFYKSQDDKHEPLVGFIRNNNIPILKDWIISIPSGESKEKITLIDDTVISIKPRIRQFEDNKSKSVLEVNRRRVGNISDEQVGLTEEQIELVTTTWKSNEPEKSVPGAAFRSSEFRKPILTISFIEPGNEKQKKAKNEKSKHSLDVNNLDVKVILAVSLSFPTYENKDEERVVYRLNTKAIEQLGLNEEDNEDE